MPKKIDPYQVNIKEFKDTRVCIRLRSLELKEFLYKKGPTDYINDLIEKAMSEEKGDA